MTDDSYQPAFAAFRRLVAASLQNPDVVAVAYRSIAGSLPVNDQKAEFIVGAIDLMHKLPPSTGDRGVPGYVTALFRDILAMGALPRFKAAFHEGAKAALARLPELPESGTGYPAPGDAAQHYADYLVKMSVPYTTRKATQTTPLPHRSAGTAGSPSDLATPAI